MAALHHSLGLFEHDACNLDMTLGRFVERRGNDLCIHRTGHVGHFFRTLVDKQHHEISLGMVGGNGVGNVFHQDGLTCLGLCHDKRTLAFADRREQVNDACTEIGGRTVAAETEFLVGEEGCKMVEGYSVPDFGRLSSVDLVDTCKREIFLPVVWRSDMTFHHITRLARAYNTVSPASGKVLTGGVDANALQKPKRFFGAARNIEGGGSLTIVATALIDTGSKMDEVIFEEFKGTGNMELQLDRSLSNKRIFPSVNLVASSTRRDDLLQDRMTLDRMWILRKYISDMNPIEAMNTIHDRMMHTRDNEEFLATMNS